MRIFRSILHLLLYGGTRTLRAYEVACIDAWKSNLSPQATAGLDRQMRHFNLIQRTPGGALVTLYDSTDPNGAAWDASDFFALRTSEVTAARVWLRCPTSQDESDIKADLVLHNGRLSSIEFNKQPRSLRIGFKVVRIKLFLDPMQPGILGEQISSFDIPGPLGHVLRELKATDLRKPLPDCERRRLLRTIDALLPDDYLSFVQGTEGATIANWRINGLSEIRRLVQSDQNYYLLAESNDQRAIGVAQGESKRPFVIIDPARELSCAIQLPLLEYIRNDSAESVKANKYTF
jgi:hypothetical protein